MNFEYPDGATPLDPDEAAGLIPAHITNHQQLNEWELQNITAGERWAFARRSVVDLDSAFIRALHKRMFGDTWRWAGAFRTSEKNIGVDPARIAVALHELCADVNAQLAHASLPLDDIAVAYSHRLVAIHPFANGNGRLSRTAADLLLVQRGAKRFSWGGTASRRRASCASDTSPRYATRTGATTRPCWRLRGRRKCTLEAISRSREPNVAIPKDTGFPLSRE